jgi:hypothetical protein
LCFPNQELDHKVQILIRKFCLRVVVWPEHDVRLRLFHSATWLDPLGQVDLMLELLPLSLGGDGETAPEDCVDFPELFIIVGVSPTVFSPAWLRCRWFIFFLLTI